MSSPLLRKLSRASAATRASLSRSAATLRTPSQWPWRRLGLLAAGVTLASGVVVAHERSRQTRLRESRVFNEGSPLQALESSLRTGDVLVFARAPFGIEAGVHSSWSPLRASIVLLQKIRGGSAHDHVAMVVLRNEYPYILERDWGGAITLRPFEARLLHTSADEVVLRRLEGPALSAEDEDRVERWVEHLMGEQSHNAASAAASTAAASSTVAVAPASSSSSSSPYISSAPRLSPWSLLRHLLWVSLLPSQSTTAPARSQSLVTLGQLTELWSEMQLLAERIAALQAREDEAAASASRATGGSKAVSSTQKISAVTGSTTTLQRLQVRQREVVARLAHLQRMLQSAPELCAASSSSAASDDPDACLNVASDFPSATLVARGLQVLGVLPDSGEPILLRVQQRSGAGGAADVRVNAARIPPPSAYAPRHFLSGSHVPLLHMNSLRAQAQVADAASSAPAANVTSLPEVAFHREMFLKMPHKPLPFTLQE